VGKIDKSIRSVVFKNVKKFPFLRFRQNDKALITLPISYMLPSLEQWQSGITYANSKSLLRNWIYPQATFSARIARGANNGGEEREWKEVSRLGKARK
jgi:hypothetical protein